MSRNVLEKVANGDTLNDDDVQYAVDRGIDLPEQYSSKVEALRTGYDTFGRPKGQVIQGGSFPMPDQSGPGLFLSVEELESLTMDQLHSLADAKGVELSGRKKADAVSQLSGGASEAAEEAENEEEAEA